eukprot:CAMPEP_0177641472 /NCGR_PEP_ID=MMETSP0447-20121125/7081_1 /TAXON_ID=0 /ORGANISM="Stygamoeba regulata, Strain BSH-02190019" /LENGTH=314 /DNA_ID=CAMNT_0019143585 /DNA_START=169 /DNA_END=1113 /DNA_ORIENTATION=+
MPVMGCTSSSETRDENEVATGRPGKQKPASRPYLNEEELRKKIIINTFSRELGEKERENWLKVGRRAASCKGILVCFPHLGGTTGDFLPLASDLPEGFSLMAVELPGRRSRFTDPTIHTWQELGSHLLAVLHPLLSGSTPCFFLGNSMGSIICLLLALNIQHHYKSSACKGIVLSAHGPPHYEVLDYTVFDSPNQLFNHVAGYGGVPDEVGTNEMLREMALALWEADLRLLYNMLESCPLPPVPPSLQVTLPCLVSFGELDYSVSKVYQEFAPFFADNAQPQYKSFDDGDHFYLINKSGTAIPFIASWMASQLA